MPCRWPTWKPGCACVRTTASSWPCWRPSTCAPAVSTRPRRCWPACARCTTRPSAAKPCCSTSPSASSVPMRCSRAMRAARPIWTSCVVCSARRSTTAGPRPRWKSWPARRAGWMPARLQPGSTSGCPSRTRRAPRSGSPAPPRSRWAWGTIAPPRRRISRHRRRLRRSRSGAGISWAASRRCRPAACWTKPCARRSSAPAR